MAEASWFERFAPVVAASAALIASVLNFLDYGQYPLLRPEIGIVIASLLLFSIAVGLLYAAAPPLIRIVLQILIAYVALDLNFDGIGVPIAAMVAAIVLNRHLMPVLAVGFSVVLLTELIGAGFGGTQVRARTAAESAGAASAQASDAPVLLHLILDEHIGPEGLPPSIPQATALREELRTFYASRGFQLFGGAYSEYMHTINAIPHILNFGAAQPWAPDPKESGVTIAKNAYFERLRELGYAIRVYQSDFVDYCASRLQRSCDTYRAADLGVLAASSLSAGDKAALILYSFASLSDLALTAGQIYDSAALRLRTSIPDLPLLELKESGKAGALNALAAMDRLVADLRQARPGQAYFAHILLPHYPYSTNPDCTLKDREDWRLRRAPTAGWEERQLAYFDQVSCVTAKVGEALDALAASPGRDRTVVVVNGDHGSRITRHDPAMENLGRFDARDMIDSFSTLFAVRAPGLQPGYVATRLPVAALLADFAASGFRTAQLGRGAPAVPGVYLEDRDWRPVRRHALPAEWGATGLAEAR